MKHDGERHPWEAELLALLSDQFGTTTGDLAKQHSSLVQYGYNQYQRSAAALSMLRTLETEGKVVRMDDRKPVAWILAVEVNHGRVLDAKQSSWFYDQAQAAQEIYRHRKSGGIYGVVCNAARESDGELLVIYRNIETGERWARPASEFKDGRFERIIQDLSAPSKV